MILFKKGNADEALQQLHKIMGKPELTVNEEKMILKLFAVGYLRRRVRR